jgi:hypothetical protein
MKPSSDIDLFTTTLPFLVLVSRTLLLRTTVAGCHSRFEWWRYARPQLIGCGGGSPGQSLRVLYCLAHLGQLLASDIRLLPFSGDGLADRLLGGRARVDSEALGPQPCQSADLSPATRKIAWYLLPLIGALSTIPDTTFIQWHSLVWSINQSQRVAI